MSAYFENAKKCVACPQEGFLFNPLHKDIKLLDGSKLTHFFFESDINFFSMHFLKCLLVVDSGSGFEYLSKFALN
jgi:hypothetical protein